MKPICQITPSTKTKGLKKHKIIRSELLGHEYIELKISKRMGKRAFCSLILRLKPNVSMFVCPEKYRDLLLQCGADVFDENDILSALTTNFAIRMLSHNRNYAKSMSVCLVDRRLEYKMSIGRLVALCKSVKIMGCDLHYEFAKMCDDIFEKTGAEPSVCRSSAKFDMIILPKTHTIIVNRQKYTVTKGCFDMGENNLAALCMISVYGMKSAPKKTPILHINDKTVELYEIPLKTELKNCQRK